MQKTSKPYETRRGGFQRTSTLVEQRLRRVGESRGFAVTRLLTHWNDIVGSSVAEICTPVKVSYAQKGFGATLIILTTGAQAQMLEMQLPQIREKVNACYGYNAISRIRITQTAPVGFLDGKAQFVKTMTTDVVKASPETFKKASAISSKINDEALRSALTAFGENLSLIHI